VFAAIQLIGKLPGGNGLQVTI